MKRVWISAMIALLVMMIAGCNEDEPKPKPEEPEMNLYPELPEGATEVPKGFFSGKYAPMPLPSTLKVIREEGLYACLNKVLVIPEGVEIIEKRGLAKGSDFPKGNVEWIYIPQSVKKLMDRCLKGIWIENRFHYYVSNPSVVMASDVPPVGFMDAIYYSLDELMEQQNIYVPESGLNNYKILMEEFFSERSILDIAQMYYNFSSYLPVRVEVVGGDKASESQYSYKTTTESKGKIKNVRWAVSDESIAQIDSSTGVLKPKKVGWTHVQCIVSTPASDGTDIEFYFFKPIEVTAKMLSN